MNYRYIGNSPTDLEGGRPIAPGDYTGDIDEIVPAAEGETPDKNQQLLEDGMLLEAPGVELDEDLQPLPVEPVEETEPAGATQLTGKALDDRAKELDIEGRSDMSADELRAAVAEAEAAGGGGDFS